MMLHGRMSLERVAQGQAAPVLYSADGHRARRRFGSHVAALPRSLGFGQPSVRAIGFRLPSWGLALSSVNLRRFRRGSKRLPSPDDDPWSCYAEAARRRNLSRDLKIAKGVLSDDADDLKAIPANLGSLPPSPSGKWVPNALRTGLRCCISD